MRRWAAILVTASAGFARNVPAQGFTLAGYSLGQTWSQVGRTIPCRVDSIPDSWRVKVKDCWPAGNAVRLTFVRDTLRLISYVPNADDTVPADTMSSEVLWNRYWKQWTVSRYGQPDSVTTSGARIVQVTAFWRRASTSVQLEIISVPGGHASFIHVEICSAGPGLRCESSALGLQLHDT